MCKSQQKYTEQNTPEKRFSPILVFSYKDRIFDSVLIRERENTGQRKPLFWYIFRSDIFDDVSLANY